MKRSVSAKHEKEVKPVNPLHSVHGLSAFFQELRSKNTNYFANQNLPSSSVDFGHYFQSKIDGAIVNLKDRTHFTDQELTILSYVYYRLNNQCIYLYDKDFEGFLSSTYNLSGSVTMTGIARYFKKDRSKPFMNLTEFLMINSILLRGKLEERSHLMFTILNFNHYQNSELYAAIGEITSPDDSIVYFKIGFDEPHSDILEMIFKRIAPDSSALITYKEFFEACEKDNRLLKTLLLFLPEESTLKTIQTILFGEPMKQSG